MAKKHVHGPHCNHGHNQEIDQKELLQAKYSELQLLAQQIKQVQKQIQAVDNQMGEAAIITQSLEDFAALDPGAEILVPVCNGIFAKATLVENKQVLVNVGSDTVVQK